MLSLVGLTLIFFPLAACVHTAAEQFLIKVVSQMVQGTASLPDLKIEFELLQKGELALDPNFRLPENIMHERQKCSSVTSYPLKHYFFCVKPIKKTHPDNIDFLKKVLRKNQILRDIFIRNDVQFVRNCVELQEQWFQFQYAKHPINFPILSPVEAVVYNSGLLDLPYVDCVKTFSMHLSGARASVREYGLAYLKAFLNQTDDIDVGIFYEHKHIADPLATVGEYTINQANWWQRLSGKNMRKTKKRFYVTCEEHNRHFKTIVYDVLKRRAYWFEPIGMEDNFLFNYILNMRFDVVNCSLGIGQLQQYSNEYTQSDYERSHQGFHGTCFIKSLLFARALICFLQVGMPSLDKPLLTASQCGMMLKCGLRLFLPEYFTVDGELKNQEGILTSDLSFRWQVLQACLVKTIENQDEFAVDQGAIQECKEMGVAKITTELIDTWINEGKGKKWRSSNEEEFASIACMNYLESITAISFLLTISFLVLFISSSSDT